MSLKQYIPALKYGNALTSDEIDLSGATSPDITFTAGNPSAGTASTVSVASSISAVRSTTLTLTSAQILALAATPVTVVTNTAGTAIVPVSSFFEMIPTSTTYTGGGTLILTYNSVTTGGNIMSTAVPVATVTSASAGYVHSILATNLTVVPNSGITIGTSTGTNYTVGTGTAKMTLHYYIVTL